MPKRRRVARRRGRGWDYSGYKGADLEGDLGKWRADPNNRWKTFMYKPMPGERHTGDSGFLGTLANGISHGVQSILKNKDLRSGVAQTLRSAAKGDWEDMAGGIEKAYDSTKGMGRRRKGRGRARGGMRTRIHR